MYRDRSTKLGRALKYKLPDEVAFCSPVLAYLFIYIFVSISWVVIRKSPGELQNQAAKVSRRSWQVIF